MTDPTTDRRQADPTTQYAAQMVRLLAATIDVVVDNWDHLATDPDLRGAVEASADALEGLRPDAEPEQTLRALERLSDLVADINA